MDCRLERSPGNMKADVIVHCLLSYVLGSVLSGNCIVIVVNENGSIAKCKHIQHVLATLPTGRACCSQFVVKPDNLSALPVYLSTKDSQVKNSNCL